MEKTLIAEKYVYKLIRGEHAPEAQGDSLGESAEGLSDKFCSARCTRIM